MQWVEPRYAGQDELPRGYARPHIDRGEYESRDQPKELHGPEAISICGPQDPAKRLQLTEIRDRLFLAWWYEKVQIVEKHDCQCCDPTQQVHRVKMFPGGTRRGKQMAYRFAH